MDRLTRILEPICFESSLLFRGPSFLVFNNKNTDDSRTEIAPSKGKVVQIGVNPSVRVNRLLLSGLILKHLARETKHATRHDS